MKCPKCGAEVPEGNWYCGKCGTEIRVVPEFEPEVETEIDASLSRVGEVVSMPTAQLPGLKGTGVREPVKLPVWLLPALGGAAVAVFFTLGGVLLFLRSNRSEPSQQPQSPVEISTTTGDVVAEPVQEPVADPPAAPVFSPADGTYEQPVTVRLMAPEGGAIYYTLGDETPSASSIRYKDPFVLEENGSYALSAICISPEGVSSEVIHASYEIAILTPSDPVVMEPSGSYDRATMIAVVAEEGCYIYYTTDGSDPSTESTRYTAPISMPYGHSVFRFVAADLDGNLSGIVEREYHLAYARLVSTEQARQKLMALLTQMDVLIDGNKQRGMDGFFDYVYDGDIEIGGSGEYYRFVETQILGDGRQIPTGLLYAVNTHDGSIHHLGYDSSGHYTLILMSDR
ncbi:MAG: chitobiase/beta-hexosaminidase C-terminal domain-containing protein [Butyrivibrio sp.]|nr:chitobiase/beta-hexosaminidase C-terminal domain-containing protein [Butyrivibrio sp.]